MLENNPGLNKALAEAEYFDGVLLEASRVRLYEEVRTREVEDGHVQPWELGEPYPYRIYKDPVSSVLLLHPDGRKEYREGVSWTVIIKEDPLGVRLLLIYDQHSSLLVDIAEGYLIESSQDVTRIYKNRGGR